MALKLYFKVARVLARGDWDLLDRIMAARLWAIYKKTVTGQSNKFEKICIKKDDGGAMTGLSAVVNLSSKSLD